VARLVSFKGVDTLLRAAGRVVAECPDARFVVLGGGPLEGDLRALAERLGIAPSVRFSGFRADDRDVVRLLGLADVFCLPTRRRAWVSRSWRPWRWGTRGGPADRTVTTVVADGETGLLVKPEDDAAYAAAIVRVLREPELGRRMGEAGRRRAAALFDPSGCSRR